jgi:hypothetical protein
MALTSEPEASTTAPIRPRIISEKYSAGPNLNASFGQRRGERGQNQRADAAGEERAEAGRRERRSGAALRAIW